MTIISRVSQTELTGECWLIQFTGVGACKGCEYAGKRDCGGKRIRRLNRNAKGFKIPLTNRIDDNMGGTVRYEHAQ